MSVIKFSLTDESGKETGYSFDPMKDITLSTLLAIKSLYPDLCTFTRLTAALGEGDPQALACVIAIARKKSGETPTFDPGSVPDFVVADYYSSFEAPEEVEDPLPVGSAPSPVQTSDSTGIQPGSEDATSDI